MKILTVDQTNELQRKHQELLDSRLQRQTQALQNHIQSVFQTPPKSTLESLQNLVNLFEKKLESDPNNLSLQTVLQNTKDKIANEDYCKPNTSDMEYHTQYHAHLRNFSWPDASEREIRSVEDLVLNNLYNSYTQ